MLFYLLKEKSLKKKKKKTNFIGEWAAKQEINN